MADNPAPNGASPGKRRREDFEQGRGERRGQNQRFRGGRGRAQQHGSRHDQRGNMGRNEYNRSGTDRRQKNERSQAKRQKLDDGASDKPTPNYVVPFSTEEVAAEDRKPKRKVAVMIGYSGTGYKGMQIAPQEKTIEGDLFTALVKAGAISKANADDPKKSSLVRCARTDKGVHAAGNVISLKLIIEDPDIVAKINAELSPQIRIWGIERTRGSFSCYQACDSRWYEYLIPTHCFVPPHPSSHIGRKLVEYAEEVGDVDKYQERQKEVLDFWKSVEEEKVKPILESLDESTRALVEKAMYLDLDAAGNGNEFNAAAMLGQEEGDVEEGEGEEDNKNARNKGKRDGADNKNAPSDDETRSTANPDAAAEKATDIEAEAAAAREAIRKNPALEEAIRKLKEAYSDAKHAWRIPKERLDRVVTVLNKYIGTHNFHNFTVKKSPRDPSAKRHIKSFTVNTTPIIINDTEWLSLKVHGQSFMMHQIRKMVGMAALIVRCGSDPARMDESMTEKVFSIPKVPGLGLLLERPVFDNYNTTAKEQFDHETIDFSKYEKEIEAFKRTEIYDRMFREEAEGNIFHAFFSHIDNFKDPTFLYLTSKGHAASGSTERAIGNAQTRSRKERQDQAFKNRRDWLDNHQKSAKVEPTTEAAASTVDAGTKSVDEGAKSVAASQTIVKDSADVAMSQPIDDAAGVALKVSETVTAKAGPTTSQPADEAASEVATAEAK